MAQQFVSMAPDEWAEVDDAITDMMASRGYSTEDIKTVREKVRAYWDKYFDFTIDFSQEGQGLSADIVNKIKKAFMDQFRAAAIEIMFERIQTEMKLLGVASYEGRLN